MGSEMLSYGGSDENYYNGQSYFQLDACSLCQKPLGHNCDIYMYRGNTPFCSQECRQEQIEIDEASEKKWKRNSNNALRQTPNDSNKKSTSNKAVRSGIVTVA